MRIVLPGIVCKTHLMTCHTTGFSLPCTQKFRHSRRCPNNLALTPFPHPARRTGHADLPHPALGQDITPSYTAGSQPGTSQTHETEVPVEVLGWISPAPATSNLVLVA